MKPIPDYLRLHVEPEIAPPLLVANSQNIANEFTVSTGWEFQFSANPSASSSVPGTPLSGKFEIVDLSEAAIQGQTPIRRDQADAIAATANQLVNQLEKWRSENGRLNAQLATHLPVAFELGDEAPQKKVLDALLHSAIELIGGDSAALYLLDDGTAELQLRACLGCHFEELETRRPLEQSIADLEAMMGHAIVIEDSVENLTWPTPAPCGSAICVPVASMSEVLGTFWVLSDHPAQWSDETLNMIEIIAGRIASELQRFAVLTQWSEHRSTLADRSRKTSSSLDRRRPALLPPVDEMYIEELANPSPFSFADWSFDPQGRLWLISAAAAEDQPFPEEIAQTIQTSFCTLRNLVESPDEMVSRIIDCLKRLEPESVFCQIRCLRFDLDSGQVEECGTNQDADSWIDLDDIPELQTQNHHLESGSVLDVTTLGTGYRITWR